MGNHSDLDDTIHKPNKGTIENSRILLIAMKENILKFNAFRKLCLENADAAIKSAEKLVNQNVNHIAFHLLVLAIEEIGKVFVGLNEFMKEEQWNKENPNFGFDDHIKKLFWAIWGPSVGEQIITKEQWEENQRMASSLHSKRLNTLYTGLNDTVPGASKISDEELNHLLTFTQARLRLAIREGEVDPSLTENEDLNWLRTANEDPSKRNFIFGKESQSKLLELRNPKLWISWLKEYYEQEENSLKELLEQELKRKPDTNAEKMNPKWRIKIKLVTPSHSIKQKVINDFNNTNPPIIKLGKGGDNHTLFVDFTLYSNVSVDTLWQEGWLLAKFYVGALNIASNGFFYWNAVIDTEKYYESIRDLEGNKSLSATLQSGLKLDWTQRKMVLNTNHLHLSRMTFDYFLQIRDQRLFLAVDRYLEGLALLSKSDIHSRFEYQIFSMFYGSLEEALASTYKGAPYTDLTEVLYPQLEKMIKTKEELQRILTLGHSIKNKLALTQQITLTEVILMKQYCGFYFITLAARKLHNDENLTLVLQEGEI